MRISVYNQEKEILVQTISVAKNKLDPLALVLFHCPYCSEGVTQIQGVVTSITTGLVPTDDVVTINKAYHCRLKYTVQQTRVMEDVTHAVINAFESDYRDTDYFHCYVCRSPLVAMSTFIFPINKICPNPSCRRKYEFVSKTY